MLREWLDAKWESLKVGVINQASIGGWVPPEWQQWNPEQQQNWIDVDLRKRWEKDYVHCLRQMRNALAHPSVNFLTPPGAAVDVVSDAREFIASLWEAGRGG